MSALECGISEKDGDQGLMPKKQREKDLGYSNNMTSNTVDAGSRAPHHHVHRSSCTEMLTLDTNLLQHRQFAADNRCGQDAANPKNRFPSSFSAALWPASSGHLDVLPLFTLLDRFAFHTPPPLSSADGQTLGDMQPPVSILLALQQTKRATRRLLWRSSRMREGRGP